MRFEITFHTPFRVASGRAGDGADSTVDRQLLLPASSLKGVMRSAARDLLELPSGWVQRVYGTPHGPSPWSWSDAMVACGRDGVRPRARIQIDSGTSTVTSGALAVAEEVLADRAEFCVEPTGAIASGERDAHETVLTASARAVTALGGDRRRGLGWVSVRPVEPVCPQEPDQVAEWAASLVAALRSLPERDGSS